MCTLSYISHYIYELRSHYKNCHLIKYADDTVIVGLISDNDETDYIKQISEVVQWCSSHNLLLNVSKTKEIIFDFRHSHFVHQPLTIDDHR